MDATQLFVTNWAKKFCPTLLTILPPETTFLSLTVSGPVEKYTQVFVRSDYATWEEHPMYSQIVAAATPAGRQMLADLLRAETYSASVVAQGVILGSVGAARAASSNMTDGSSSKARLLAKLGAYNYAASYCTELKADYSALIPMDTFMGRAYVTYQLAALAACGFRVTGPFTCAAAQENWSIVGKTTGERNALRAARNKRIAGELVSACGPTSFPMHFMLDPAGNGLYGAMNHEDIISRPYYYVVAMQDGTIHEWAHQKGVHDWNILSGAQYPTIRYAESAAYGDAFTKLLLFIQRLNPTLAPPTPATLYGVTRADTNWLPLCVLPGKHQLLVRSAPENFAFVAGPEGGPRTLSITVTAPDVVGVLPVQWYVDYATEQVAKGAANASELQQAIVDMEIYKSKSITFVAYDKPEFLEADLVYLTTLYADYKKAMEKACEEDEFAKLPFTSKMTYGELNTLINGSRSTRVFYGYRDAGERSAFTETLPASKVGWVLTGGSAVVTARRPDGTFAPSYGADNGDAFLCDIALGANLVGTTVEQQIALWGLDPAIITAQQAGLKTAYRHLADGFVSGSPTAYYDFRWESVGVTGIPDVRHLTADNKYRTVMTSKGAVAPLGAYLQGLLMEEVTSFYAQTLLAVTPPAAAAV